jgi:hypothetical protein
VAGFLLCEVEEGHQALARKVLRETLALEIKMWESAELGGH